MALCLAPFLSTAQAGTQQQANGFTEDARWSLFNRLLYEQRDYKHGGRSNGARNALVPRAQRNGMAEEFGYGLMGQFESGFTQGTVGVGVDAHLYLAQKLDGGGGRAGKIRHLPVDNDGHDQNDVARGGAAIKAQLSSTLLRYGEQRVKTPIFSSSDSRLLPETHTGWYLNSREFSALNLHAGHFTGSADRNSRSNNNRLVVNYANPSMKLGNAFSFVGGSYSGLPGLSLTAYTGEFENTWRSHYLGGYYSHALAEGRGLSAEWHLYRSTDTGRQLAGDVDNTTGSLLLGYQHGHHKFGLGYQKVDGDTPFDYVTRGAIWISNASQLSDFNAPNEASWQLRYDYDLAGLGIQGLTFGAAYTRGSGIDGSKVDPTGSYAWLGYGENGKHWERDLNLRYTVQEGAAKGLVLFLRHSMHRGDRAQAEIDADQIRLAVEYPLAGGF
ncbi:OprD family porin [Pseudomonas sp. ABC1]|uniref:OprD family porin n=1 Tax=Pseudomonas sp. ABC1 TaxID=2748080 RepID=UPI0015C32CED|nr:OprD family porin [Pseudomonas sp. ABC1]QLF95049.1 OprD family porin [Pseudomonas sp. ABC1]